MEIKINPVYYGTLLPQNVKEAIKKKGFYYDIDSKDLLNFYNYNSDSNKFLEEDEIMTNKVKLTNDILKYLFADKYLSGEVIKNQEGLEEFFPKFKLSFLEKLFSSNRFPNEFLIIPKRSDLENILAFGPQLLESTAGDFESMSRYSSKEIENICKPYQRGDFSLFIQDKKSFESLLKYESFTNNPNRKFFLSAFKVLSYKGEVRFPSLNFKLKEKPTTILSGNNPIPIGNDSLNKSISNKGYNSLYGLDKKNQNQNISNQNFTYSKNSFDESSSSSYNNSSNDDLLNILPILFSGG